MLTVSAMMMMRHYLMEYRETLASVRRRHQAAPGTALARREQRYLTMSADIEYLLRLIDAQIHVLQADRAAWEQMDDRENREEDKSDEYTI